jgi:phosphoesterase RecJ-like protein
MIPSGDQDLFRRIVDADDRFVLTTHMNPDGDAIGSEVGLARFLVERGKHVRIVNQDATPHTLAFLEDDVTAIEVYDPAVHDTILDDAGRIVLLDNSASDRLGRMEPAMRAAADRVLCIDHHPTLGTPWKDNILDEASCATAAMVYGLILACGAKPDARTAEALFVGVATDTGFFRFNSTTAQAYEIASTLMRAGVHPARCYQQIYERNSAAYTRLLGHALAGLRLDADGAVASVRVTRKMVTDARAGEEDTSEMTTALLAIDGVRIAILFRETDDRQVKVSLRSKGSLDVRELAMEFGGGGHRNASGIVLEGEFDEVIERVLDRAATLAGSGGPTGRGLLP